MWNLRTPTNENNGGTEWQGIQQLLRHNQKRDAHIDEFVGLAYLR